jgi:hypothetical protein
MDPSFIPSFIKRIASFRVGLPPRLSLNFPFVVPAADASMQDPRLALCGTQNGFQSGFFEEATCDGLSIPTEALSNRIYSFFAWNASD